VQNKRLIVVRVFCLPYIYFVPFPRLQRSNFHIGLVYYREMAKLTREDVLKLARLSRLQLTDEEVVQLGDEISAILQYVEQLQGVDVSDLEPTNQVTGLKDVTRKDEIKDYGYKPEQLLNGAPAQENGHIKVKRMLQ
jgi:aspartyl-tRNA(Asn)/glutamyl-tRNA(Gln) amidotransferase subunit C